MFLVWLVIWAVVFFLIMEACVRLCVAIYGYIFHEFPVFNPNLLKKFASYDAELGWEPQPGNTRPAVGELRPDIVSSKKDTRRKAKSYYAINADGSRKQPPASKKLEGPYIELFGDSACMCRDVNDDETFPYFLEEDYQLGPCKNFGSGNYGSDQAYLRAKRRMKGGGVAILFVTIHALERNAAVYKHYSEPGNYWAVKPRFVLNGGKLEYVPRPFVDRSELANLADYADHFHKHDNHFENFISYSPVGKKSHFLHMLKNSTTRSVFWKRVQKDSKYRSAQLLAQYFDKIDSKLSRFLPYQRDNEISYEKLAQGDDGKLFALIAKKFIGLATSRGSTGMIVLTPQGRGISKPDEYRRCLEALVGWCDKFGIKLYDFGEELFGVDEDMLKKYKAYSTHLSKEGNQLLASWLSTKIASHINENINHQSKLH